MWFTSDNAAPVHPTVMDALARAGAEHQASYGAEAAAAAVRDRLREVFEAPAAEVFLVPTGTAANALALACLCAPFRTVYCHREAHIEEDECGAPEFYTGGAKLTLLEGADARIDPSALEQALASAAFRGVQNVQPGAVSLTQATERGAVYSLDHLRALTGLARAHGLPVHMDGARFANALARLGCTPAEMTWKAGVDVLSFGATKNGLLAVEAVVFFDPGRAAEFPYRRKRGGHLISKHRALSAQMEAYLADDLWRRLAATANARADLLAEGLATLPGAVIHNPVEANMIFASLPRRTHRTLLDAGARYGFMTRIDPMSGDDGDLLEARFVANWATPEDDIRRLLDIARGA